MIFPTLKKTCIEKEINTVCAYFIGLFVLNTCDIFFTLYALDHGFFEANYLMRKLIEFSPIAFIFVKNIIIILCLAIFSYAFDCGKFDSKFIINILKFVTSIYLFVLFIHIFNMTIIFGG